ncbi:hypothetical protein SAMN04488133_1575 [Halobellus limi]|uniref:Uncharacterized protein n=1 Tax=Halobellus limi TaxID=699433 RepID=A0A1H5YFQ7_9EURY|nr:hypothetical protein SAMN04488133_1575 [Halobellus limi]
MAGQKQRSAESADGAHRRPRYHSPVSIGVPIMLPHSVQEPS